MPQVFPFAAIQYKHGSGDVSSLVAPPYDVLDAGGKRALLAKDQHNIVAVDLPHTPAKELGPAQAYADAAALYRQWLQSGTLSKQTPAMFAYRQTFHSADGKSFQRSGMACTVETVPFGPRPGGGILPHEETFSGPKEDRFALMKATRAQLSPIFGLFADDRARATNLLHSAMAASGPAMTAKTADGVTHEVWTISDSPTIKAYQDALAGQDVFIADGHHRYTTGLNYLKLLESQGPVPAGHPARRCMMVLVGMSDPGLVIWPTHRVLGGMKGYTFDAFRSAASGLLNISPAGHDLSRLESAMAAAAAPASNIIGLYDFQTRQCYTATFAQADPLKERFPAKPPAWRRLDVALIQYVIVEQVCQPRLNAGQPVKWAFPHTIHEVIQIGAGAETGAGGGGAFAAQLAVIVRPTPLDAVRAVSAANELMPQKSTFFYPKLATGLYINPLE
jgi:uncharacterized protein (DUF1015 family)